jgi:guanylate kinase
LAIFVKPPSIESLIERLKNRSTDSIEAIDIRIKKATYELTYESHFDKVIVNDDLETAKRQTLEIVENFLRT